MRHWLNVQAHILRFWTFFLYAYNSGTKLHLVTHEAHGIIVTDAVDFFAGSDDDNDDVDVDSE